MGNVDYDEELGALKGMIDYPCGCKARALIYEGSGGKFSVPCPVCGRFACFDSVRMTATVIRPVRGAIRRMKPPGVRR